MMEERCRQRIVLDTKHVNTVDDNDVLYPSFERGFQWPEKLRWVQEYFRDTNTSLAKYEHVVFSSEDEITSPHRVTCGYQIRRAVAATAGTLCYYVRDKFSLVLLDENTAGIPVSVIQNAMLIALQILNDIDEDIVDHVLINQLVGIKFVSTWDEREIRVELSHDGGIASQPDAALNSTIEAKWRAIVGKRLVEGLSVGLHGLVRVSVGGLWKGHRVELLNDHDTARDEAYFVDNLRVQVHDEQKQLPVNVDLVYLKPRDAFQHPNRSCMVQALQWFYNKISTAARSDNLHGRRLNVLELYGGFGAHTMFIGSLPIDNVKIDMVELDARLTKYGHLNIEANGLAGRVKIFTADAATQARKLFSSSDYDLLILDPPRQGLQDTCRTLLEADQSGIKDILYVSCCLNSLYMDLELLTVQNQLYVVKDIVVTDLVPQSDDLECLVHLVRNNDPEVLKQYPMKFEVPFRQRQTWMCCSLKTRAQALPWQMLKCPVCNSDENHPTVTLNGVHLYQNHKRIAAQLQYLISKADDCIVLRNKWMLYLEELYQSETILTALPPPKFYDLGILNAFVNREQLKIEFEH